MRIYQHKYPEKKSEEYVIEFEMAAVYVQIAMWELFLEQDLFHFFLTTVTFHCVVHCYLCTILEVWHRELLFLLFVHWAEKNWAFKLHHWKVQFYFAQAYIQNRLNCCIYIDLTKILNSTLDDCISRSEFQVSREKALPSSRQEVFFIDAISQTIWYTTDNCSSYFTCSHFTKFCAACIAVECSMWRAQ